ncbi:HD domain-containing phosphohydrolase [Halomonas sp. LBP4]|uniref:HD domain-containing phosphohydrolase n=1 Tax=Halomonas sp. LBP4 TaxID=2044917 RepID=UPI000D768764|nr:HD domain-containing phosphohydrolase [Halomonas sp. LBP4]PXX96440.1 phosphohydrolase [Halomonas sp. LBP4]
MTRPQAGYIRVESPAEIEALLEALSEPGGASLQFDASGGKPLPVLVEAQQPGDHLLLDISAIREVAGALKRGQPFRLLGQARDKMLRTPPLVMGKCFETEGRLQCQCPYPLSLDVLQRRESFRARLRLGMEVGAILRGGEAEASIQGDLKDLSLEGCQLELPLGAASRLASALPLEVELCFPNGTRFVIRANPRHHVADTERQAVRAGFRFVAPSGAQERQLWFFVREIEREATRLSKEADASLLPSPLFQAEPSAPPPVGRRNVQAHATPMARRLAKVAGYLDAQLLELQQGRALDSVQLSRHADRLLALHDEDREGLLFAPRCMLYETVMVRHGLAVAVHLLDLAATVSMPRDVRKAMVACAMVHDLGKALLPKALLEAPRLDRDQRAQLHAHVALLRPRLEHCQWLAGGVVEAVVERINERLDGSGYPRGLSGERLHELTRLAMVVDVVEAMRRNRADRPAWGIADIYRHLLGHPARFDPRWVKRYIRHFGLLPIGSLVRFEGGELGWVQGLDERGQPARVQLAGEAAPPGASLGEVLQGERLARLGPPVAEVPVST